MRIIYRLVLLFFSFSLLSSGDKCFTLLPNDLVIKIMSDVIPNFLSPTHPEEIFDHDQKLAKLGSVCKKWQILLGRLAQKYMSFRNMEKLFVRQYNWPSHEFIGIYPIRFETFLNDSDRIFYNDEQGQVVCYQKVCTDFDRLIKHPNGVDIGLFADLIEKGFYDPYYTLLQHNKAELWYELFTRAKVHNLNNPDAITKVNNAFACQYLKYCQVNQKVAFIEGGSDFSSEVMEKAKELLTRGPEELLFCYENYEQKLSNELTPETLPIFSEYVKRGGSLTEKMYKVVWRLLSNNGKMEKLRIDNSETVKEIMTGFDFNVLLAYILSTYLATLGQPAVLTDQVKGELSIDFTVFLNKFHSLCVMNKADAFELAQARMSLFFGDYKDTFARKDRKDRLFLDCLLLTSGSDECATMILKAFMGSVGEVENYLSVEQAESYRKAFKEKYFRNINRLSDDQRDFLVDYGVPGFSPCSIVTHLYLKNALPKVCGLFGVFLFIALISSFSGSIGHPFVGNLTVGNITGI